MELSLFEYDISGFLSHATWENPWVLCAFNEKNSTQCLLSALQVAVCYAHNCTTSQYCYRQGTAIEICLVYSAEHEPTAVPFAFLATNDAAPSPGTRPNTKFNMSSTKLPWLYDSKLPWLAIGRLYKIYFKYHSQIYFNDYELRTLPTQIHCPFRGSSLGLMPSNNMQLSPSMLTMANAAMWYGDDMMIV